MAEVYRDRSPIHHTDRLSKPMLILQGLDDMVVLPDQAERMIEALDRNAIPMPTCSSKARVTASERPRVSQLG
jgi:dipeptidyl aminopeptidase/acylaminoacyl peptidase